jgi:hypothetical protein
MPPISTRTHAAAGAAATGAAMLLRRLRLPAGRWLPLLAIGVGELALAVLTRRRPALTAGSEPPVTSPAPAAPPPAEAAAPSVAAAPPDEAAAPSVAAAPPVEAPGPSVTPPQEPRSDVERAEEVDAGLPDAGRAASGDVLVAQQEAAAAAEAAAIGGHVASETGDPAMDPVYEAGGGEQEGWEAAEADLIETASHGDTHVNPERDALTPERETDRSSAVYGEPDQEHSTEVEDTDR